MAGSSAELISCLQAALNPDTAIRQQAEAALAEGGAQEGFCVGLINIALHATDVDAGIRQLSAVLLRRAVRTRWSVDDYEDENTPGEKPGEITDAEKAQIRAMLPAGLAEQNYRIQTAVGTAIAEIGKYDCPGQWPELLPGLIQAIDDSNNPCLVAGATRCLGMLVEDLSDTQVTDIAPVVLPQLLRVLTSITIPTTVALRRRALLIFETTLEALELTIRDDKRVKEFLSTALPPWVQACTAILATPTTMEDTENWAMKFDALGCLLRIVSSFAKLAVDALPTAMSATWQTFVDILPMYKTHVVFGFEDADLPPSGFEEEPGLEGVSLPDLVSQLFEFIMTLIGNPKFLPAMRASFPQLAYLTLGYLLATNGDIAQWSSDVNAYLGEEQDFWGPRASGELLFEEIAETQEGVAAVAESIAKVAAEAAAARAAGDGEWWRLRESVLLGIGYVAEIILEMKEGKNPVPQSLEPENIAAVILNEDLAVGVHPLVAGRALWLLARLARVLSPAARAAALRVVGPILAPGNPPQAQAGACQALAQLCGNAELSDVQAISQHAFAGLCAMLPGAEEEALHLMLETLTVLVKADASGASQFTEQLVPAALSAWMDNINDPFVGEDASDLLRALAATPACLPALQTYAVPTLCEVITNIAPHSPFMVGRCLDMLTTVLAPSSPEAARGICAACATPALKLLGENDMDEYVVAAATALLRTMLQVGGHEALVWAGSADAAAGVGALLQAVQFVMRPETNDHACKHVGGLLLELLRHAAPLVSPHLPSVLAVLVTKLATADEPSTVQSFIQVLASLIIRDNDPNQLVQCLVSIPMQGGTTTALHVAMQKWTERQIEVRTPYDIRLTTAALGALLTCKHPALDNVMVRGKRTDQGNGIRTRSRAASQAEEWSQVPLRVKIVMLLSDAFIEAATQLDGERAGGAGAVGGGGSKAEEEEWIDSDDDDDDDDAYEDDDEDFEDDFGGMGKVGGGGGLRGFGGKFDEYGGLFGGFDSDDDADDHELLELANVDLLELQRRKNDALSNMDVGQYLADLFKGMATAAPETMQAAAAELTPTQVEAVQKIWQA